MFSRSSPYDVIFYGFSLVTGRDINDYIKPIKIPLPPLPIQEEIV
jgi:hypothetical protein